MKTNRILIGVGGGIAAYKVCEIVSTLAKAGHEVRVILTTGAQQFVTPLTFATLSRHAAYTDTEFWQPQHGRPLHIELGEWADVLLMAPLTANTLAKLAYGLADNLLMNTVLASTCPVLLAPAMNTDMWEQQVVQRNWQLVQQDPRFHTVGPGAGLLACDRVGMGRMAEPDEILPHLLSLLWTRGDSLQDGKAKRHLQGKHLLISAGGTREFLDPVRFIGNPATGKMGWALARAALHQGATVTLVMAGGRAGERASDRRTGERVLAPGSSAPDPLTPGSSAPGSSAPDFHLIPVQSAAEMQNAMLMHQPTADWIIMAAAVADVKPATYSAEKLPKRSLPQSLPLESVPDIAADLASHKQPHQMLIGFAAQTGDIVPPAWEKLQRKGLDAIAANPIDQPNSGFGSDQNQAVFLDRTGRKQVIPPCSKLEMAHHLYAFVQQLEKSKGERAEVTE